MNVLSVNKTSEYQITYNVSHYNCPVCGCKLLAYFEYGVMGKKVSCHKCKAEFELVLNVSGNS